MLNEKYNFVTSINQMGNATGNDSDMEGESHIIKVFEEACISLSHERRPQYTMIEMGAANAYYSLLFRHIVGKEKCINFMVEPIQWRCEMGRNEFKKNNCWGIFYENGVGKKWEWNTETSDVASITIKEIMEKNRLDNIDMLHCDIDGSELEMLLADRDVFESAKIKYVFLYTHVGEPLFPPKLHEQCKDFFHKLNYDLIYEWRFRDNTSFPETDDSLVYRRKKI